jgi:hypothetical protein
LIANQRLSIRSFTAALLLQYYTSKEDWQVQDDFVYNGITSVDMPQWALLHKEERKVLINERGNSENFDFSLNFKDKNQMNWLLLILYLNRNSKAEQEEFSMLMGDDSVTTKDLIKRVLSDSTIRSRRYLRLYHKNLIRSNKSLLIQVLNQESYASVKNWADSETELTAINNVDIFKYLRYYKGFKDHLEDVRSRVIITRYSILSNPQSQIDNKLILEWEEIISQLSDELVLNVLEHLLFHRKDD